MSGITQGTMVRVLLPDRAIRALREHVSGTTSSVSVKTLVIAYLDEFCPPWRGSTQRPSEAGKTSCNWGRSRDARTMIQETAILRRALQKRDAEVDELRARIRKLEEP